jgi:hypothetical protein
MPHALEAGSAAVDITPETHRQTIYHRSGGGPCDSVPICDPVFARATAFRGGGRVAVWVSLDVCVLSSAVRRRVLTECGRRGIEADQITLASTHTHSAPTGHDFHGVEPMAEAYVRVLVQRTVDAIGDALCRTRAVDVAFGSAPVDLSVNRRQIGRMAAVNDLAAPSGLVDNEVRVVVLRDRRDGTVTVLFNYAAHPLATRCREQGVISADFPGRAIADLCVGGEISFAQFMQGCAGDVNVKISGEGAADLAGSMLATAVRRAVESAVPSRTSVLRTLSESVRLPWADVPTPAEARAAVAAMDAAPEDAGPFWRRPWAAALVRTLESGPAPTHAEVLVQAVRLGDVVMLALPGEVFVEIGLDIRRRAGVEHLVTAAYANNGEIGYIPTVAAFAEGGMEVDSSPYYYGLFQLAPDCGPILTEAALRLLSRLEDRRATE